MKPTVEQLDAHVRSIADQHGITIVTRKTVGGHATRSRMTPTITVNQIRSPRSYIIAMHELGHILGSERSARRIIQEIAAWEWALAHSIARFSNQVKRGISRDLSSYVRCYVAHGRAWLPSPEDRPDVLERLRKLLYGNYGPRTYRDLAA